MNQLPPEVIENIIFNTKPEDIAQLCKTNVLFSQLCSGPEVQEFFDILGAKQLRQLEGEKGDIRKRLSPEAQALWAKTARPYIREYTQRYPQVDRSSLYRDLSPTPTMGSFGNPADLKRFRQGVNRRFVRDNPQFLEELARQRRLVNISQQRDFALNPPPPSMQGSSLEELGRFE